MRFGYFDVDCRELSAEGAWIFRPRVLPIAAKVERLLDRALSEDAPVVATTCGSGRMPDDRNCPGGLHVPMDPGSAAWETEVARHRSFHLQKACGSWHTFDGNGNAGRLFGRLALRDWVVFGNGLDLCVDHVVTNLVGLGLSVTFLSDVLIPSAKGYGPDSASGTEANRIATLERWRNAGAVESDLESFLAARQASWVPKGDFDRKGT